MKYILFIFIYLTPLFAGAKNRVIDYPSVGTSNSNAIEIKRVEWNEKGTFITINIYSRDWSRIAKTTVLRDDKRTYKLLRADGIEIGKKTFPPKDKQLLTYTLCFEPLDPKTKSIDFIEEGLSNGWELKGIQLEKQKKKAKFRCVIEGEVINRPNSLRMALIPLHGDLRVKGIYIPIIDGHFSYTLELDYPAPYELIFLEEHISGSWQPFYFMAEKGEVKIALHEQYKQNQVVGGQWNKEFKRLENGSEEINVQIKELERSLSEKQNKNTYYSAEGMALIEKVQHHRNKKGLDSLWQIREELMAQNKFYTPEVQQIRLQMKQLSDKNIDWTLEQIKQHPSVAGLAYLENLIFRVIGYKMPLDLKKMVAIYKEIYAAKYHAYPSVKMIENLLNRVQVGEKYIDCTALDLSGESIRLSSQIAGKVALIDLWASWCGSCIRNAIEVIPIWKEYESKGFTVVGIARENGNTQAMENAIKRHKFPWLNLVEHKDQGNIWCKYGLGNAGGGQFLVDATGKIIAKDPTAQELREWLEKLIK